MKQKMTIKVQMNCDKCRSKALKIVAKAEGVNQVAIEGPEKDQVVVIGDGVDSVCLTSQLRKKFPYACLVSVQEEKEKVEPKKEDQKGKVEQPKEEKVPSIPSYFPCPQYPMYEVAVVYDQNPTGCSIM